MQQNDGERAIEQQDDLPGDALMPAAHDFAWRILSFTAGGGERSGGGDARYPEHCGGVLIEGERFARMAPTTALRGGLDAWIERRKPTVPARPIDCRQYCRCMAQLA
ncbi:hypothetical protein [Rhizobium aouanii]|uniref:hypothetical protein n=1 Tax=Rhizobium aouanii TaxID=3118145 RepID=UPI0035A0B336